MNNIHLGPRAADFVWASGIEDTFVPQTRPGHRALDEYQLMGHYEHWREDLSLARLLGVSALRWGVPWYRVEPLPGEFDWRWTDQVISYLVEELKITPIVDLMHYGCPFWLWREFANRDYPQLVALYAAAFAERYKHLVRWYTPCNEPLVGAKFSGMMGAWPPYLRGDRGYVKLIVQLAKGILATVAAIKEVQPDARFVHVEATGIYRAAQPDLEALAAENTLKGFIVYDLISGRVTPEHPLYGWLLASGTPGRELEALAQRAIEIDVMGLNFYPQWSTQELFLDAQGSVHSRATERDGAGFGTMIEGFYRRYGVPIMITETSARDSKEERSAWLERSLSTIRELRAAGIPVMGYTWFPLFTMIDWDYRWKPGPLEKYLLDLGMFGLERGDRESSGRWKAFPTVDQFRWALSDPESSVGNLN